MCRPAWRRRRRLERVGDRDECGDRSDLRRKPSPANKLAPLALPPSCAGCTSWSLNAPPAWNPDIAAGGRQVAMAA